MIILGVLYRLRDAEDVDCCICLRRMGVVCRE